MFSNTLKWIEIWKLFEVWTKFSSYFIYQECGLTTIHNLLQLSVGLTITEALVHLL